MPNSMFIKTHFSKPINLSKHYKPYFSATFVGGSVMCDKCEDPEKCHEVVIVRRYTQNEFTSHLGVFQTIEEAIKTRKDAEIKYYGEYVRMNK